MMTVSRHNPSRMYRPLSSPSVLKISLLAHKFRRYPAFPATINFPESIPFDGLRYLIDYIGRLPATTPVADRQLFTGLKQFLILKPGIYTNDNRNNFRVICLAFIAHMRQHLIDGIAMIRLLLATTEYGLNDLSTPVQL